MTEFLPVSSSGHLVIFQRILGIEYHDLAFDVGVHVGTLLSVVTIFHKLLARVIVDLWLGVKSQKWNAGTRLAFYVVLGSIPTAIMGLSFKKTFEQLFQSVSAVGVFLFITGTLLFLTRIKKTQSEAFGQELIQNEGLEGLNWKKALLIGFAQGCAIAPGLSRAGSTIAAGIFLNVSRKSAATFSFMLSIPAIVGASVLELRHLDWRGQDMSYIWIGGVSAYIFGLLGLWLVLRLANQGRLDIFSYYLWVVGILAILVPLVI
jgi:undecaprenyl-diphosphatase